MTRAAIIRGCALALALIALAPAGRAQAPVKAPLKALFIGNSYTAANDLPELVAGIAAAMPDAPAVVPGFALRGGMTLDWHLMYGPAMPSMTADTWNTVVLQEQSLLGGGEDGRAVLADPRMFQASVREFVKRIRARHATPVLLMTWPRRDVPSDGPGLERAYLSVARELNIKVAPAGSAWMEAERRWPWLDLYAGDGAHPNAEGSYLAACVLYATLTGQSPAGAPASIAGHVVDRRTGVVDLDERITLVDLDPKTAGALQEVAWDTVSGRSR